MTDATSAAKLPSVDDLLARMDTGWTAFRDRLRKLRTERLEEHIGEGWTRKQMLAHVATWHDLTIDRLGRFAESGEPAELEEQADDINARAARAATGRTTGEIIQGLEESYRRLRREVARLSDAHLAAHDSWAAAIVRGNTFEHYEEHLADLG